MAVAVSKVLAYLEHVQQSRLSGIVETQEQNLGMLVKKAQVGQNVVNYRVGSALRFERYRAHRVGQGSQDVHQSIIHIVPAGW